MTITLRATKGSALTYGELDGNFSDLDGRLSASQALAIAPVDLTAGGSAAAANTTAINDALAAAAAGTGPPLVSVLTPGTYVYNDALVLDSYTGLYLGLGVVLQYAAATGGNLVQTDAYANGSDRSVTSISCPQGSGTATVTFSNSSGSLLCTWAQAFVANQAVIFTGGTEPTGITARVPYYVSASGLSGASFKVSTAPGGTPIAYTDAGSATITGTAVGSTLALVNITAHGRSVGDWVALGGSTTGGCNGVFRVESVTDADNYAVRLLKAPSANTAAGTLVERAATHDIFIGGPGYFDGNKANRSLSASKDDASILLGYAANVWIDVRCRNSLHSVIHHGYTNGIRGPGLLAENCLAGIIGGGPHSNMDIERCIGHASTDDIFAVQGSDYSNYTIGTQGDCLRNKVGVIRGNVAGLGNGIKVTGASGFVQELEVGTLEVEVARSDLVQIVTDPLVVGFGTDMGYLKIGTLRHINPAHTSAAVCVAAGGTTTTLRYLEIGSLQVKVPAGVQYNVIFPNNTSGSIERTYIGTMDIEGATANQDIQMFRQVGAITNVQIDNVRLKNCGLFFSHDSSGSESGQKVQVGNFYSTGLNAMCSFRRAITLEVAHGYMETTGTAAFSTGSAATLTFVGNITADKLYNFPSSAGTYLQHISGDLTATHTTLTSAQLLALNATPRTLVAAPGSNASLEFVGAEIFMDYGSAAYAGIAGGEDLAIRYTDGSGTIVGVCETTGFLDQTADQLRVVYPGSAVATTQSESTPTSNAALVLHMLSGEITTGDSLLYVKTYTRTRNTARAFG